ASCTCRSVVPQKAHDELASIDEMVPNAALPNCPFGLANCGWLNRLNASTRSSVSTCPTRVFLMIDASTLACPGPRTVLRPVLPSVAVASAGRTKHDVSNHLSIVGLESAGSHTVFGRLVTPVEPIVPVCVMVKGSPDRRYTRAVSCHPPHTRWVAH